MDLPTPEEPRSATVRPGTSQGARESRPSPGFAAITRTGHARGDGLDLGAAAGEVVADVGLVQQHDGHRPALPGEDQRALEPSRVEVPVEAHHEEDRVHVGGQHLGDDPVAGRPAEEGGPPGQHRLDDGAVAPRARRRATQSPTAGRSSGPRAWCRKAPRHRRERLAVLRAHAQQARVADDDAARHEALGGERRERLRDGADEAEFAKSRPRQAHQPRRRRNSPMKPASAATDSIGQAL